MFPSVSNKPTKTRRGPEKAGPPASTPRYKRVVFILVPFIVAVGLAEAGGRLAYELTLSAKDRATARVFWGIEKKYNPNQVFNFVPHHYLNYVLNPNAKKHYKKLYGDEPQHYINRHGFRGKEFAKNKEGGVFRVFCLGGSTTFGLTEIDEEHTYPAVLERTLNERFASPRFEVINAGTPGWTSAESLINFQFRVLDYDPDLVIVYHGVNDTFAMRTPGEGESDYRMFRRRVRFERPSETAQWWLKNSGLFRYYYWTTYGKGQGAADINNLATRKGYEGWERLLERATGKYFVQNIENIVHTARGNGVLSVLVTMGHGPWHRSLPLLQQHVRRIAGEKGALLIDFERASRPDYFMSDGVHLTRKGRTALAASIVEALARAKLGFVER